MGSVPASAAVASPHECFFDHNISVVTVHINCYNGGDEETKHFHNTDRKACLQHAASFIDVWPQIARLYSEWAKAQKHRVGIPIGTVRVRDEIKLIYARNERTEESKVNQGHKRGGSLRGRTADHSVKCPEDSNHTDNEEDQNIVRCQLIVVHKAIDKVSHHANNRNQKENLHHPTKDEKGSKHFDELV